MEETGQTVYQNETAGLEAATSTVAVHKIAIGDDIVSMEKMMGLDVNSEDIKELVQLQNEQQKSLAEEMSSEEEEGKGDEPKFVLFFKSKKFVLHGVMCKVLEENTTLIQW